MWRISPIGSGVYCIYLYVLLCHIDLFYTQITLINVGCTLLGERKAKAVYFEHFIDFNQGSFQLLLQNGMFALYFNETLLWHTYMYNTYNGFDFISGDTLIMICK